MIRNFSSVVMNMALLASSFSTAAPTSAYDKSLRANYSGNNSCLIDEGLNNLKSGNRKHWSYEKITRDKGDYLDPGYVNPDGGGVSNYVDLSSISPGVTRPDIEAKSGVAQFGIFNKIALNNVTVAASSNSGSGTACSSLSDQNFNYQSNALVGGLSKTIDGITYNQASPTTGADMATFNNSIGQAFFEIENSDAILAYNLTSGGSIETAPTGAVDFRFSTSDGCEFQMESMVVEIANNGVSTAGATVNNSLTITGYRDGSSVVSDSFVATTADAAGSVTYALNVGSSNGGTLTFDSNWENVDEIRFTGGSASTRTTLAIDDLTFATAVASGGSSGPCSFDSNDGGTIDDTNFNSLTQGLFISLTTNDYGQSFKACATGTLSSINVFTDRTTTSSVTIKVYEGLGNTGTLKGTISSLSANNTAATTNDRSTFDVSSAGISVTSGSDYTFYISSSSTVNSRLASASIYADGSVWDGNSVDPAGGDILFGVTIASGGSSNSAPSFNSSATASVDENTSTSIVILDVNADDGDGGSNDANVTYSISGDDADDFNIDTNSGELTFKVSPNFEAPIDSGTDNVYNLTVTADDGEASDNTATQDLTITVNNVSESFTTDIKVWLEGAFNGTEMNTDINSSLPAQQPYNGINSSNAHSQTTNVASMPSGAVDWVLVEFRDANSAGVAYDNTKVGSAAGLLMSDGSIKATDGSSNLTVPVNGNTRSSFFIVVYHRNHLPIMSKAAITESSGSYTVDLRSSTNVYTETTALALLSDGSSYGMPSGDINQDGSINGTDLTMWRSDNGTTFVYGNDTDLNLDGTINAVDRNDFYQKNTAKTRQVPGT